MILKKLNLKFNSISEIIDFAAKEHLNKSFAILHGSPETSISFKELSTYINQQKQFFSKIDGPIAFYFPTSILWSINFLSVLCNGQTAVVTDTKTDVEFALKQLANASPKLILTTKEKAAEIKSLWNEAKLNCPIPNIHIVDPYKLPDIQENKDEKLKNTKSESAQLILYTSGSTGNPKGVVLTHDALLSAVHLNLKFVPIKYAETQLSIFPFSHIAGITSALIPLIATGTTQIFLPEFKPSLILEVIKKYQIKVIYAPPVFFEFLCKKIAQEIVKLSKPKVAIIRLLQKIVLLISAVSPEFGILIGRKVFKAIHQAIGEALVVFFSGGATLPQHIAETLFSFGFYIVNGYGTSEIGGIITFNTNLLKHPNSVGRVDEDMEVRIENPDDQGVGEVAVKSNQTMKGYLNDKDQTDSYLKDGWLKTGDLGYLDSNRYLFIRGRSKNIIVTSEGKKIHPQDLEEFFTDPALFTKVIAFPLISDKKEYPAICVEIFPGVTMKEEEIKQNLYEKNAKLPTYMRAKYFFIEFEPLPITKNGKTDTKALIEKYQASIQQNPDTQ